MLLDPLPFHEAATWTPQGRRRRRARQSRAEATVTAVLHAAIELIEEGGESAVTVRTLEQRSGVSSGSIYHHFGDRDGVIAAAQTERFDQVMRADAAFAAHHFRSDRREDFLAGLEAMVASVFMAERRRVRRQRLTSIASAQSRPELRARLQDSFTALVDALETMFVQLRGSGAFHPDLDTRAGAVFSESIQLGLVLNEIDRRGVDAQDWSRLVRDVMVAIVEPSVPTPPSTVSPEATTALLATLVAERGASGASGSTAERSQLDHVLELATAQIEAGGTHALRVQPIIDETGVSNGWFSRRFGDRDGLLDAARLALYEQRSREDLALLQRVVADATDAATFRSSLANALVLLAAGDRHRRSKWRRADFVAATLGSEVTRSEVVELVTELTDALTAVFSDAQARGLLREDLAPRAVAHFIASYPLSYALAELDRADWSLDGWRTMLERAVLAMTPDWHAVAV